MISKLLMVLVLAGVAGAGAYYILKDYGVVGHTVSMASDNGPVALVQTNYGNFKIQLYQNDAPNTVANFVKLAGQKFYDGLTFHRVIKNFMIQGGDPECSKAGGRCGTGGPGYKFADELNPAAPSYQAGYQKGVVAMANSGPNTNGSQFFVMAADLPLPHQYTIFGKVIEGQNIVDAINITPTDSNDRPTQPVTIEKITIQS